MEDVVTTTREAAVCLVPLRFGGGIRLKILEALANARRFARDGIDLSLIDDAGNTVVRLIQTDAD